MTISTKVRTKEMIADVFPSENAVNIEDAKILIPAKCSLLKKRKSGPQMQAYVSVPFGVNISTMIGEEINANAVITTEEMLINQTQILKIRRSSTTFLLPVVITDHRSDAHGKAHVHCVK